MANGSRKIGDEVKVAGLRGRFVVTGLEPLTVTARGGRIKYPHAEAVVPTPAQLRYERALAVLAQSAAMRGLVKASLGQPYLMAERVLADVTEIIVRLI